ncbi:MAG: inositol monophosphatase family protein [Pseudomonadota bacterium]
MIRSALMHVMTQAVTKAGRGLARDFGEVENLQVSQKGPGDFVSQADLKAEQTLRRDLEKARPGYSFLMEESGSHEGTDPDHRWIVDPLDGTTNFLHGIPLFAISLGLERAGEMVAGVIFNPASGEMFVAEQGKGAFLTGTQRDRRLRVSGRRRLDECVLTMGIPHKGRGGIDEALPKLHALMQACVGVRRTGAAAIDLAWVAAGRFDGFYERGLSPWDIAAGLVIVREAGGFVSDTHGRDTSMRSGEVVAANPEIHDGLIKTFKSVRETEGGVKTG